MEKFQSDEVDCRGHLLLLLFRVRHREDRLRVDLRRLHQRGESSGSATPHLASDGILQRGGQFFTRSNKCLRFRITDSEINNPNTYRFGRPDRS
jgi:hypothetical protein